MSAIIIDISILLYYRGEYYIEPKKFYKSIELLLDAYKLESQVTIIIDLCDIYI